MSNSSAERFNHYSDKVAVVYGGVDTQFFKSIDLPKEQKIACVARIYPHKGQNYLIDAMPKDLRLNIIGRVYHNDFYNLLVEKSKDKNVKFITDISDQNLVREYSTSLANVLPSVYRDVYGQQWLPTPELFGLTLVESMSCGTPVIASDAGGTPEIVEDGKTGFIVPPNDISALHEKIEYFADNPSESYRMGKKARKAVEERFTWDKVARRCLKAYGIEGFEEM
jgi:glycosyltransferase involved in cell wall biosynthesis